MNSPSASTVATDHTPVDAGPFGVWLQRTRAALRGEGSVEVPCGDCVGCCSSGYPVPLRPEDRLNIARIPLESIARVADGRTMILARPDGTCPMLRGRGCSVYEQRPQTCRDYDCRVFAAAGILAGGEERSTINSRVGQWRFSYPSADDTQAHEAVRRAAAFIRDKGASFPGRAPTAPTGIAVLAIKAYRVFMEPASALSDAETARAIIAASREFDTHRSV